MRLVEIAAGGRSTVLHTHDRTDEWVFILAGRAVAQVGEAEFEVGSDDFIGYPAGGPAHLLTALEPLMYLVGGQVDASDVVTYPLQRKRRIGGRIEPL